jgi:hypothetical protein
MYTDTNYLVALAHLCRLKPCSYCPSILVKFNRSL